MMQTQHTNRLTVLLSSDDDWPQTIRLMLEPQGVHTLSARTGREALELLQSNPVHVAVVDEQMPQLGGLQVIQRMRGLTASPPAILLARQLTAHLLQEALRMQVFTVLVKPPDLNQLLDAIARVMRRYYEGHWPGEG